MPDLPTLTVTDAQAVRMLAVFGDVATYKAWLRSRIVAYVLEQEQRRMAVEALEAQRAALGALRVELET